MNLNVRTQLKNISNKKRSLEQEAHSRKMGLVSVCIPNFNKGPWIYDCIKSIREQTYYHLEVIVVDDFSTDNSRREIERAVKDFGKFIPIKTLYSPKRVGTAWAQNMAYYLSQGEFIANMDSDDLCAPYRIESQVRAMKANAWDAVGTNFTIFKEDPRNPEIKDGGHWLKYDVSEIEDSYLLKSIHCVCFGSLMVRYPVIEITGGMNKEYIGTEDFDMVLRIAQKGFTIGNLKEPLYYYRSNGTQRSTLFHSSSV